jgi:hypothetical protein
MVSAKSEMTAAVKTKITMAASLRIQPMQASFQNLSSLKSVG